MSCLDVDNNNYSNDNNKNDGSTDNNNDNNNSNVDLAKLKYFHASTSLTVGNMNKEFQIYSTIYAYHLLYNHNLEIKITTLPDCNFYGLYTKKSYCYDEIICQYYGDKMRTIEAIRLKDKSYLMRLGEQCYIDAKNYPLIYAR